MEIKWGDKGDEGQSCENMNEVHLANQDQLLSLECCAACTRQPIQSQKATLWQGRTLFLVVRSSLLELSTNYQRCLLVISLPKCSWSSSCMLRRGSNAHCPSSDLRPGNIFSQSHLIEWSLQHQNVMLAASTSPSAFIIPPVLLADLGRLMNDDAWRSSAGTRSSPASARCAERLPPFLMVYAKHAGSTKFLSKRHSRWWAISSFEPQLWRKRQ